MQNLTVHLGGPSPFLLGPAHASPRSRAPKPSDRSTPPVSGTAARHCAAAHPPAPSLLRSIRPARARGARRPRAPCSGYCRAPSTSRGQAPWHPHAAWHPHARTPHLFPPLFPSLPRCRRIARSPLALLHSSSRLHCSRAPEPPHHSPHSDRHLQPPAAHSPSRILAEHRCRPPLPGELLPELPIPTISCNFLTPLPLRCCRTPHPPSPPTKAPLPTDERHRPMPFAPPHHRPAVPVRPCPLLLARHLPRDPLEISGNT